MKYKIGDKLRVLNPEKCDLYNNLPNADHIVITDKDEYWKEYSYDIYNSYGQVFNDCSGWFTDKDLAPYDKSEKPKQPQLTYEKKISYIRSDGIVFEKDQVKSGNVYIPIELLKEHANLYKTWLRRKF
jgi:hypothetical protein